MSLLLSNKSSETVPSGPPFHSGNIVTFILIINSLTCGWILSGLDTDHYNHIQEVIYSQSSSALIFAICCHLPVKPNSIADNSKWHFAIPISFFCIS